MALENDKESQRNIDNPTVFKKKRRYRHSKISGIDFDVRFGR